MSVARRGLSWLLAGAIAAALSSCAELRTAPPDGSRPTERQGAEWTRIETDGVFRSIEAINSEDPAPHLTAAGVRDGKPLVAYIVGGGMTEIPFRNGGARGGGLRAMTDDGQNYAVTDVTDPASGRPARMWHGYSDPPDPQVISPTEEDKPLSSTTGLRPLWLSPLSTSEDFGVIGVVRERDRWKVHGWLYDAEIAQLDVGAPLYLRDAPSSERLLTGITEGSLVAAGDLTDRVPGTGSEPQLWSLELNYGPERTSRWENMPLDPVPDGLTDISTWELGWQLAGHKDLAPVVYDYDDADGAPIAMPSTRLDPEHPGVFLVLELDAPPILATQSVDGPKVWFNADGRWRHIAAPEGRLQAIELAGYELYLLIDGSIWHMRAPDKLLDSLAED